jgi:hypothetical protein
MLHQALVHQRAQCLQNTKMVHWCVGQLRVSSLLYPVSTNRLACGEREIADENAKMPEHALFTRRKELIAPVDRVPDGLLPRQEIASTAG